MIDHHRHPFNYPGNCIVFIATGIKSFMDARMEVKGVGHKFQVVAFISIYNSDIMVDSLHKMIYPKFCIFSFVVYRSSRVQPSLIF